MSTLPEYTLRGFMAIPNIALKYSLLTPFTWNDSKSPQEQEQQPENNYEKIRQLIFVFLVINLLYPYIGLVIYVMVPEVQRNNYLPFLGILFEMGAVMCFLYVAFCKMLNLIWHRKRLVALLEEFQEIFPSVEQMQLEANEDADIKEKAAKLGYYRVQYFAQNSRRLMKHFIIFCAIAITQYNLLPVVEYFYELLAPGATIKYRCQTNTWYPWQIKSNSSSLSVFILSYTVQAIAGLTGVAYNMNGQLVFYFFVVQMQMHFDFLSNAMEHLDARSANANQKLKYLINYHQRLLRLSHEINSIFNMSFLASLTTASVGISLMSLAMLMITLVDGFKYAAGFVFLLVMNYVFCSNGHEFTVASNKLKPAAFYSNWYEGDLAYRKMILFYISRTSEENVMQVYKYTSISMETYMTILKFSYQLFTFFRTMDIN